jgi:HTH-type transcriptional regulator/antitoxin HigA
MAVHCDEYEMTGKLMTTYTPQEATFDWTARPGSLLQRELDAQDVSQAQLAARTGFSAKHINLVIKGHAPLSPDVAVTLEDVLGTSADAWLRMEASFRAHEARVERSTTMAGWGEWAARFPRDILIQRSLVLASDHVEDVVAKLLRFFGVASPDAFTKTCLEPQASFKRSQHYKIDPYLTALWLRLGEVEASSLLEGAPAYDAAQLRLAAEELPNLTREDVAEGFRKAQRLLLDAGVALVFVPEIDSTRISGVSKWLSGRPMIAVTSRYRRSDSFWFTILHEVAHVLLHPKRGTYVDFEGNANDDEDAQESAANAFAEDALLPRKYRSAVISAKTPEELIQLASQIGRSPSVVAGQRAFLTGEWGGPWAKLRERIDLQGSLGHV